MSQTPLATATPGSAPRRRRAHWMWLFLLPAVIPYAYVVVVPSLQGLAVSFTDWDGLSPQLSFVGIENFGLLFSDQTSLRGLTNTFIYAGITTVAENVIGLLLALGLHSRIKSRNVLRVAFFIPVVLLSVVVAFLWKFLLQPTTGTLTQLIRTLGFPDADPNWLGDPQLVVLSICIIVIWQFSGYTMVIYLAGLQSVPAELTEAAALDGANSVKSFWHIVRPLLAPAIAVNLTLSLSRGFMIFDQIWATTGGGPASSSHSLSTLVYQTAFQFGQLGMGAAIAVVLSAFLVVFGWVQYRGLLRTKGGDR
jgi:raffinose/stachyose/melibiose transport system permease protein